MNYDLYDTLDYNAISDVFLITDMTIREDQSNYNLLNVDMLSQMLPFSDILENKKNKQTYKNYLNLMMHFIGKAYIEKKYSILRTFGDFLKGICSQRVVLYYFMKLLYLNLSNVFYSQNHFIHILSELLEQQFKQLNSEINNSLLNNESHLFTIESPTSKEISSNREIIKSKKLTCLLILSFLDLYDTFQYQDNTFIKLHHLFSETKVGLSMVKAIISSCFSDLSSKDKYKFSISKNTDVSEKITWEMNNRKIIYYFSLCINLFVSNYINTNEENEIISFIINCFNSLVSLFNKTAYSELLKVIFVENNTIAQIFFHHCIEIGFKLENFNLFIYFSFHIIDNSFDNFLFHFLLDECYNIKAEHFVDVALPLIGNQITNNVFFECKTNTLSNLIKWTVLIYHLVSSLRKDILIAKDFELLKKLFEQLHKSLLLYTKIEVIIDSNNEKQKKQILELVFELIIKLYSSISEENQKRLLLLFDSVFFIQKNKTHVCTIPYCIDTQIIFPNAFNIAKEELKKKIIQLENNIFKSYSKTESNITLYFLFKVIVHRKNLCRTDDEITDEVLNNKMNNMIKALIDDVMSLRNTKMKNMFKDSKCNPKLLMKTKEAFEIVINNSNKYEFIEKEILEYFHSYFEINEEDKFFYIKASPKERIIIAPLLTAYDLTYQPNNNNFKPNQFEDNKLWHLKGSHNSSSSVSKGEINGSDKNESITTVDFKSVNYSGFIYNTKKHYLLTIFSTSFHNIFLKNEQFIKLQKIFVNKFEVSKNTKKMRFPSKFKNFTNGYYPPLFLKQNLHFFDDTFFEITHEYYKPYLEQHKISLIPFTKKKFKHEGISGSMQAELITLEHSFCGDLLLEKQYIMFESGSPSNDPRLTNTARAINYLFSSLKSDVYYGNKQIFIFFKDINEIFVRRFLLMHQAVEIYLKNGKSYFFNLFKKEHMHRFIKEVKTKFQGTIIEDGAKEFLFKGYTKQWHNNEISSFDYLSYLNKYATRTFRDTNQYPVFPWLLYSFQDFFNDKLDKETVLRRFNLPITIRTNEKQMLVIEKYQENTLTSSFGYHFGCHYSTGPFVYYYLMRIAPFTQQMIKLQNNELESANRMFISFDETLKILEKTDDNREIIPQFFSMIEFFLNVNCIDLKKRKIKNVSFQVDNIELPHWDNTLATYANFVLKHLQLLNSNKLKKLLPSWIDNIFGINQLNTKEDSCIIFQRYTYEKKFDLEKKLDKLKKKKGNEYGEIIKNMIDKIQMVINFGQTPMVVLKETSYWLNKNEDEIERNKKSNYRYFYHFDKGIIFFDLEKSNDLLFLITFNRNIELVSLSSMKKRALFNTKRFEFSRQKKPYSISKVNYICVLIKAYFLFVLCRHLDQSIKVYEKDDMALEILCEDFVCSLATINDDSFFSGLHNGKLIEWGLVKDNNGWQCNPKRYIMAHDSPIYAICVNQLHNIVITSAKEDTIYIRKLYDFELLSVIINEDNLLSLDIKVSSCNYVYILYYNDKKDVFVLKGYSLNGLNFAISEEGQYINFEFTQSGNIIIGDFQVWKLSILSGGTLEKIGEFKDKNIIKKYEFENLSWFKFVAKESKLYLSYSSGDFVLCENVSNLNKDFL